MSEEISAPTPPAPQNSAPPPPAAEPSAPAAAPPHPARTPARGLRFEWLGDQYYRVGLHYGESFLLLDRGDMERLSEMKNSAPELLLSRIIDMAGDNRFLRSQLKAAAEEGEPQALAAAFQAFSRAHRF